MTDRYSVYVILSSYITLAFPGAKPNKNDHAHFERYSNEMGLNVMIEIILSPIKFRFVDFRAIAFTFNREYVQPAEIEHGHRPMLCCRKMLLSPNRTRSA